MRDRHGGEAFDCYHRALFRAHHRQDRDLTDPDTLVDIAADQDLEEDALRDDLRAGRFRSDVGADHEDAEELDIFGVPTILFHDTQPIFLKLDGGEWEGRDDLDLFRSIYQDPV